MATSSLFCGARRRVRRSLASPRCPRGASLIELIIVLFIIGIMASLLFPALQSARRKAQGSQCQNNLRQLDLALRQCIQSWKRFPDQNRWSVDILKWMEEDALAQQIMHGIQPNAELPRPKLYRCEEQYEPKSKNPNTGVCHYVLAVDRPTWKDHPERVEWYFSDRTILDSDAIYDPWYVGPEKTLNEQRVMFDTTKGPHTGGLFNLGNGQTRGG